MTTVVSLDLASWKPVLTPGAQQTAVRVLEGGGILTLPHLAFRLAPDEARFLSPRWGDGKSKNISLDGAALKGATGAPEDLGALSRMIARFAANAADLVTALFPRYAAYVTRARTSFRPQPAVGRAVSWRKDDSRLHIDAFPSRPNHGERILRVFSNVSLGEDRVWRVGESFEAMAFFGHADRTRGTAQGGCRRCGSARRPAAGGSASRCAGTSVRAFRRRARGSGGEAPRSTGRTPTACAARPPRCSPFRSNGCSRSTARHSPRRRVPARRACPRSPLRDRSPWCPYSEPSSTSRQFS